MLIVIREATCRVLKRAHAVHDLPHLRRAAGTSRCRTAPGCGDHTSRSRSCLRLDFRFRHHRRRAVRAGCGAACAADRRVGCAAERQPALPAWLAVLAALVLSVRRSGLSRGSATRRVHWPLLRCSRRWSGRLAMARTRRVCLGDVSSLARTTMVGARSRVCLLAAWTRRSDRGCRCGPGRADGHHRRCGRRPFVVLGLPGDLGQHGALVPARDAGSGLAGPGPRRNARPSASRNGSIERHREALVAPAQLLVMDGVYAAAWPRHPAGRVTAAVDGPRPCSPFSMTTLHPVHSPAT